MANGRALSRAGGGGRAAAPSGGSVAWWGLAVSALTLTLAMIRLGGNSLWTDEAYTGLLGSQILKFGLPRVADGGLLVQWVPGDAKDGLWIWDGWLQAYLSAGGEAIFGRTALGARFFHALAGALIPWAAYPLFRAMSVRRGVAEAATLLTGLSVPLLLFIRQARYYPEGMLLTILILRGYHAGLHTRPRAMLALLLFSVLLFHTNFLWFALVFLSLVAHLALLRPPRPVVARFVATACAMAALIIPYAAWVEVWNRRITEFGTPLGSKGLILLLAHLRHYLLQLNLYASPLVLLLFGGAVAAGRARPLRAAACLIGVAAIPIVLCGRHTAFALWIFSITIFLLAFLGAGILLTEARKPASQRGWMPGSLTALVCGSFILAFATLSPYPFFRYLTPLLPLMALLTAQAIFALFRWQWLSWTAVVIVLITNAPSSWPLRAAAAKVDLPRMILGDRNAGELREIQTPPWSGAPNLGVALLVEAWRPERLPVLEIRYPLGDYLSEISNPYVGPIDAISTYLNAHKREGDRFFTNYGAYPIAYHTGMAPQFYDPGVEPPRWVIPRAAYAIKPPGARKWIERRLYQEIRLDAVDTPYQNRPEPDVHHYRTVREGPKVRIGLQVD